MITLSENSHNIENLIIAGGLIAAPSRIGKTTACINVLNSHGEFALVCKNNGDKCQIIDDNPHLYDRVFSYDEIRYVNMGHLLIIDECFTNPAMKETEWHCAIGCPDYNISIYDKSSDKMITLEPAELYTMR